MKTKYILMIGMILLLVANISAVTPVYKSCSEIDLSHPLRLDEYPSTSIKANITIFAPNSSVIVNFQSMSPTANYDRHNYTLTSPTSCPIGTYIYDITSTTGSSNKTESFAFEVTTTGEKVSLSNIIMVIAFLLLAGMFLYLGSTFNRENWILKTSFFIFALLMGLLAANSARIIASESLNLSKMGLSGFIIMISVISLMVMYILVYATIQAIKMLKNKKELRWKY